MIDKKLYLMYPYGKQDLIPDFAKWEKSEQDLGIGPPPVEQPIRVDPYPDMIKDLVRFDLRLHPGNHWRASSSVSLSDY